LSEYNPRTISKSRLEDLKRSLAEDRVFFEGRRVLVNANPDRYGVVIGGHMRVLAAKELG
jgi:ParB-like chromosome segregation protein Spo0J